MNFNIEWTIIFLIRNLSGARLIFTVYHTSFSFITIMQRANEFLILSNILFDNDIVNEMYFVEE